MLNWNTTTAPAALVAELTAEIGPLLPAFRRDDIYITGGRLARAACGLPRGEDIDILLDVDAYSGLRSLMYQAGWRLMQGRSSTGFRGDEEGVHFREKWAPPRDTSFPAIDCLVLTTGSQFPEAPGHHRAAEPGLRRFAESFRTWCASLRDLTVSTRALTAAMETIDHAGPQGNRWARRGRRGDPSKRRQRWGGDHV